jgi:uncharacterized protein (DUF488 family)
MSVICTIGHSSQSYEEFATLLRNNGIEVVVDVRSAPYSRFARQFDRELLNRSLIQSNIKYLFLGRELGGRPDHAGYYDAQGHVLYGRIVSDPVFSAGIDRLERGISDFRVVLMCGEENPAHCHRRLLVGRVLVERGHQLLHIRTDGRAQTDAEVTAESGKFLVNGQPALFSEMDEDQWRSTASVSPKKAPASFSRR